MRNGKLSRAEKAERYDALAFEKDRYWLVLHDVACGRRPDAEHVETEPCGPDDDSEAETLHADARAFRLLGAEGGLVLLRTWTSYRDGSPDSSSDVRVVRLDDVNDLAGGERYFDSAYGRAVARVASALRSDRKRLYDREVEATTRARG